MLRRLFACFAAAAILAVAPARAEAPPPPDLPPPPPPPPNLQQPPSLPPPPPPPPSGNSGTGHQEPRPPPVSRGRAYPPRGQGRPGPVSVYVPPEEPRSSDAHVDRVMLGATAETHPGGTFFASDYDIAVGQVGYAFTDRTQVALSFAPSIFSHQPYFADVALKTNVHRGETLRLALLVAADAVAFPALSRESFLGVRGGGIAQICFERACRSSLSLGGNLLLSNRENQVVPLFFSGGFVVHLTPLVKLLAEPAWAGVIGHGALDGPRGFLLGYAVRFSRRAWGLDLGFEKPFDHNDEGTTALGYPFVAVTWRGRGP